MFLVTGLFCFFLVKVSVHAELWGVSLSQDWVKRVCAQLRMLWCCLSKDTRFHVITQGFVASILISYILISNHQWEFEQMLFVRARSDVWYHIVIIMAQKHDTTSVWNWRGMPICHLKPGLLRWNIQYFSQAHHQSLGWSFVHSAIFACHGSHKSHP